VPVNSVHAEYAAKLALTEIIGTQNETALKLAVCIDRNTAALQEVSKEIWFCRERRRVTDEGGSKNAE
jgi:hypothetical protein